YERRYLHVGEPVDGLMRIDGVLTTECGAAFKTALDAMTPSSARDDTRTPGQRRHDALLELSGAGAVPAETVRRFACDSALTRIIGKGELDAEVTRAVRTTPPATRRAVAERDRGCGAQGCGPPPQRPDAQHVNDRSQGAPTT